MNYLIGICLLAEMTTITTPEGSIDKSNLVPRNQSVVPMKSTVSLAFMVGSKYYSPSSSGLYIHTVINIENQVKGRFTWDGGTHKATGFI